MFISMHSILGWASFCLIYCINAAWHGGDQFVALLRCNEAQVALISPSGHLHCWVWCLLSSSWLPLQVRRVCWTIKHSNTMVIEPAFGTFGSVGRCQVLLENEISISIKLVSRKKHVVLKNFQVDGCVDCGLQKTQWTNTSRWHGSPNHHWLWKLHTGPQATWILCLSTLPPDCGTLISKWNAKCTFFWQEDFGPLSNSPVLFLFSPVKMFLMMFLFQKWLGSSFPEDVGSWWLLIHWLQLQFTPCEALPSVWIGFAWQCSQACGHPCCLCTFSYPISSFQSTLHLICFDTALCEQSHLSVMTLCDLLSFWKVSMIIFWTIAKSAVFPIIVFSKNKRYPECILYGWSFIESQM